jgi:hypothetical protein
MLLEMQPNLLQSATAASISLTTCSVYGAVVIHTTLHSELRSMLRSNAACVQPQMPAVAGMW